MSSSRSQVNENGRLLERSTKGATRGTARDRAFGFISLFTSFGTLICCALPALLVLLGLGATVASFLSAAPWLVTLSQHKAWVFAGAGALIAANVAYVYALAPRLRQDQECAAGDATACGTADRVSRVVLWMSAAIYAAGFFTAYLLPLILA